MSRYDAKREDEFEPGLAGRVLRNRLGIVDPRRAELVETSLLTTLYRDIIPNVDPSRVIDSTYVLDLHGRWLSEFYPFAGTLRTVNVSKGGVLFAPVAYLPQGMEELDAVFRRLMPCKGQDRETVGAAIAESHAEFIVVHPFREGNGRLGRLLADVMATQAGFGPLAWSLGPASARARYFAAMSRGFVKDYAPLTAVIREALRA